MRTTSQAAPAAGPGCVLECVVNVSEGRDRSLLTALAGTCGPGLLDMHSDAVHNRSVFTVGGQPGAVEAAVQDLARAVVSSVDLRRHEGAHPRFGALDVVPWVALEGWPLRDAVPGACAELARGARERFARWAADELSLPVFVYGPERTLPEVRRQAWRSAWPDFGPLEPHPSAGAVAAGWRPLMVAYNLWVAPMAFESARSIAAAVRSPAVRALAFCLAGEVQISCNLLDPLSLGPADVWDTVAEMAPIARAELVGLVPQSVVDRTPQGRWAQLDLGPDRTIESRLRSRARTK